MIRSFRCLGSSRQDIESMGFLLATGYVWPSAFLVPRYSCSWKGRLVPGAEAQVLVALNVRAEARTYLRGNGKNNGTSKSNGKNKGNSRFPAGMTKRKARAKAQEQQQRQRPRATTKA
jgi:hypothetical protein